MSGFEYRIKYVLGEYQIQCDGPIGYQLVMTREGEVLAFRDRKAAEKRLAKLQGKPS